MPDALPRLSREAFVKAYRQAASEFRLRGAGSGSGNGTNSMGNVSVTLSRDITTSSMGNASANLTGLPDGKYVVLHVRGTDKKEGEFVGVVVGGRAARRER